MLAHEILHPRLPLLLRPLRLFFQLPMVGLLPPSIRAAYGFPWDRRREHLLQDSARLVRPMLRPDPEPASALAGCPPSIRAGAARRA